MRTVALIIGVIILIYGSFSTLMHDRVLVGEIGREIGLWNLRLFGYLAYIDFIMLFYPLYLFYRNLGVQRRREGIVGWILFLISMLIVQTLLLSRKHSGLIGAEIYDALSPYIGLAGLWLLWIMIFSLSIYLLIDEEWEIGARLYSWLDRLKENQREKKLNNAQKNRQAFKSIGVWIEKIAKTIRNPFNTKEIKDSDNLLGIDSLLETTQIKSPSSPKRLRSLSRNDLQDSKDLELKFELDSLQLENDLDDKELTQKPSSNSKRASEPKTASNNAKKDKDLAKEENKPSSGVTIVQRLEENAKLLDEIEKGRVAKPKNFRLPKLDFLAKPSRSQKRINEAEIDRKIGELLDKLKRFKIEGDVIRTYSGPLVTTFEFKPAPNVKVSKVLSLQDDLAMALSAETIRIQAPIPGRDVIGIEIPNESFETIYLREILESKLFQNSKSPLTVALGKDIVGNPFVTDLKRLPHLLIAGTTGSGKSVGINAMLLSLLYRNDPDHLKLILIDPKMLEFSIYNDIPHLLTPVIIEPKKAISALANMVFEMERRYKVMAENRVKNIDNYNEKARQNGWDEIPFIVVVIDELADLMMNGGKEVEYSIARLAQMARAAGIHLIVATQRPSVDVVTGLIKANLPSRLSYRVGQKIDSKVILDQMGAESLLGRGDALFTPPGATGLVRLHAPWSSEEEIERIVEYLKAQREPEYDESYLNELSSTVEEGGQDIELDPLYEQAKEIILNERKTSISYLQRKLQIGYNRSANLIEQLERGGVLSAPNSKGQREILI